MTYDQWLKYLEARLHRWAEWYAQDNDLGLGYPSCSLEYRIMHEGLVVRSSGHRQLSTDAKAEEIEALIREMSQYNIPMASALRCHYFSQGGLREKSKRLNLSHSQYKYFVDLAHQWLIGRLSGDKK